MLPFQDHQLMRESKSTGDARRKFSAANTILAGHEVDDKEAFDQSWNAGRQSIRLYHGGDHFYDIAGHGEIKNWVDAVRFRAGINHDVIYQHVDQKVRDKSGFAEGVENAIAPYIAHEGIKIAISPDPALANNSLFQAALTLFGFDENERKQSPIILDPYKNQNEFLSALYAMEQGKRLGIPDKYILAEMAHIEATVPFKPADRFEVTETCLRKANKQLSAGQRLSDSDIVETIDSSVRMANDDVKGFKKSFGTFADGSRLLLIENVLDNPINLDKPDYFLSAAMKMVGFLDDVVATNSPSGKMRVFHSAHNNPDAKKLSADEATAIGNIKSLGEYLRANAAAAALAAAIHVSETPDASAADTSLNDLLARKFILRPREHGELTQHGEIALKEAKRNHLITDQVAAYLLDSLGSEKTKKLAELSNNVGIQKVPANPSVFGPMEGMDSKEQADDFLEKVEKLFPNEHLFKAVTKDLRRAMHANKIITDEPITTYADQITRFHSDHRTVVADERNNTGWHGGKS